MMKTNDQNIKMCEHETREKVPILSDEVIIVFSFIILWCQFRANQTSSVSKQTSLLLFHWVNQSLTSDVFDVRHCTYYCRSRSSTLRVVSSRVVVERQNSRRTNFDVIWEFWLVTGVPVLLIGLLYYNPWNEASQHEQYQLQILNWIAVLANVQSKSTRTVFKTTPVSPTVSCDNL